MEDNQTPKPGQIMWVDLTAPDASAIRDFYSQVVGWEPEPVEMGGYSDFNMLMPGTDTPAAGVCHARGQNAGLPAQWLLYIAVADLAESIEKCQKAGGKVIVEPIESMDYQFCVIQDPAGAVAALIQINPDEG